MITTTHLDRYYEMARADWNAWYTASGSKPINPFDLEFEVGRKYIKAIHNMSNGQKMVHGFIVRNTDGKFTSGDLLKSASWKAPATNFARGNIITETNLTCIHWTGVL